MSKYPIDIKLSNNADNDRNRRVCCVCGKQRPEVIRQVEYSIGYSFQFPGRENLEWATVAARTMREARQWHATYCTAQFGIRA